MSGASTMQAGDTAAAAMADAVRQALTPHRTAYDGPAGRALAWSDDHWQAVADLGLPKLLLPEAEGRGRRVAGRSRGGDRSAGRAGRSVARRRHRGAGLAGVAAGRDRAGRSNGPGRSGLPRRVAGPGLHAIDSDSKSVAAPDADGIVLLNGAPASAALPGATDAITPFRQALAAARALQIAGAAAAALELTVGYVRERSQFGRPLARFQAIQQHIAVAAAEVAAAAQMARAAFAALDRDDAFLAASAKIAAGRAGTIAAKAAHQFHGAMGFTAEYPLHRLTRAIWQWREDFGNEAWWSRRLGTQVCEAGADELWPRLAGG